MRQTKYASLKLALHLLTFLGLTPKAALRQTVFTDYLGILTVHEEFGSDVYSNDIKGY